MPIFYTRYIKDSMNQVCEHIEADNEAHANSLIKAKCKLQSRVLEITQVENVAIEPMPEVVREKVSDEIRLQQLLDEASKIIERRKAAEK